VSDTLSFNPEKIIKTLAVFDVSYILIGALAARLQGFPRTTSHADITPAPDVENIEKLADALRKLKARVFTDMNPEGFSFDCSANTLRQSNLWNLITSAGRIDVVFKPTGSMGYKELKKNAVEYEVYGQALFSASLNDIILLKKASDRPQDRQDIIILNEMIRKQEF
jgi:hypothetical protein